MTSALTVTSNTFDVGALIRDENVRILICCGSGGVGKTTTSASLAISAARVGRKVCLITIDPAKRLAQVLGVDELTNSPAEVNLTDLPPGGALNAMMLDMKGTFDDLVRNAVDATRAKQIMANPFYVALSTSFAGTQEYMAMEKLAEVHRDERFDLVVVDTPPASSTLDFLDSPKRLGEFLNGRFIRLLTAPARIGGRLFARALDAGTSAASGLLDRVLGAEFLKDVSSFITNFDEVFGGFQSRAERTYALLQHPMTKFILVTTPTPEPIREADQFLSRLQADRLSMAGVIVNRVQTDVEPDLVALTFDRPTESPHSSNELAEKLLKWVRSSHEITLEQSQLVDEFRKKHPNLPVLTVPWSYEDSIPYFDLESQLK